MEGKISTYVVRTALHTVVEIKAFQASSSRPFLSKHGSDLMGLLKVSF